jgi:hypothetical protein
LGVDSRAGAPGALVTLKLVRAKDIGGGVLDGEGEAEPNATVAAVLSSAPGIPSPPIFWSTDGEGRFAQDQFEAGTYYLWARRGDMLAYPPSRIELTENQAAEVKMTLSHKGARVLGQVQPLTKDPGPGEITAVLLGGSPLAFPRKAIAKVDQEGHFAFTGLLPGRYHLGIRNGMRNMAVVKGPREVEVPIEPGSTVTLKEPVLIRPQAEE